MKTDAQISEGNCLQGTHGIWMRDRRGGAGPTSMKDCKSLCRDCARCRFVSYSCVYSSRYGECDWFYDCDTTKLVTANVDAGVDQSWATVQVAAHEHRSKDGPDVRSQYLGFFRDTLQCAPRARQRPPLCSK